MIMAFHLPKQFLWILPFALLACLAWMDQPAYSQKNFRAGELKIGDHLLAVRLAETPEQHRTGLSGASPLQENEGMLFIYDEPGQIMFHMKDVAFPLSIAFADKNGKILAIQNMSLDNTSRIYLSPVGTQFAVEVNQGWFAAKGIENGEEIGIQSLLASMSGGGSPAPLKAPETTAVSLPS